VELVHLHLVQIEIGVQEIRQIQYFQQLHQQVVVVERSGGSGTQVHSIKQEDQVVQEVEQVQDLFQLLVEQVTHLQLVHQKVIQEELQSISTSGSNDQVVVVEQQE
jgi:hypothetical protein